MSFLSTGAFTSFVANTKAKSAEVNANFAAIYNFFNTSTSEILVGTVFQKLAVTSSTSYSIVAGDGIRTLVTHVATTTGNTVVLPTASVSTNRMITIYAAGNSAEYGVKIQTSDTLDTFHDAIQSMTVYGFGNSETFHCDGSKWYRITGKSYGGIATTVGGMSFSSIQDYSSVFVSPASNTTIDLPTSVHDHLNPYKPLTVNKANSTSNPVTINPAAGGILGESTYSLYSQYDSLTLQPEFNGSTWHVIGGFTKYQLFTRYISTAASHTIGGADLVRTVAINVNTSTGYTVTLPTAASSANRILSIKNIGQTTGSLTVDGNASETIDNTTVVSLVANESLSIQCDGSNWSVIGHSSANRHLLLDLSVGGGLGTGSTVDILAARSANVATIQFVLSSGGTPSTTTGSVAATTTSIPIWARPTYGNVYGMTPYDFANNLFIFASMSPAGTVQFDLRDFDTGVRSAWPASTTFDTVVVSFPI